MLLGRSDVVFSTRDSNKKPHPGDKENTPGTSMCLNAGIAIFFSFPPCSRTQFSHSLTTGVRYCLCRHHSAINFQRQLDLRLRFGSLSSIPLLSETLSASVQSVGKAFRSFALRSMRKTHSATRLRRRYLTRHAAILLSGRLR